MFIGNDLVVLQLSQDNTRMHALRLGKVHNFCAGEVRLCMRNKALQILLVDQPGTRLLIRLRLVGIPIPFPVVQTIQVKLPVSQRQVRQFVHEREPEGIDPIIAQAQRDDRLRFYRTQCSVDISAGQMRDDHKAHTDIP